MVTVLFSHPVIPKRRILKRRPAAPRSLRPGVWRADARPLVHYGRFKITRSPFSRPISKRANPATSHPSAPRALSCCSALSSKARPVSYRSVRYGQRLARRKRSVVGSAPDAASRRPPNDATERSTPAACRTPKRALKDTRLRARTARATCAWNGSLLTLCGRLASYSQRWGALEAVDGADDDSAPSPPRPRLGADPPAPTRNAAVRPGRRVGGRRRTRTRRRGPHRGAQARRDPAMSRIRC
jgi:hypothetical protein